jgi:N-methylhydantoinase B
VVDPGGPNEREVDALADAEPVRAGEVIRIRTTGGGGWGDPFDRDPALVAADVRDGKVSVAGARDDYGVVVAAATGAGELPEVDVNETARMRDRMRADQTAGWPDGQQPFFDRGPGYRRLAGRPHAELDLR